jgi:hypothetical protein
VVHDRDGWTLLHVEHGSRHPGWLAAIAAGPRPRTTVLGARLAPLPAGQALARIAVVDPPATAEADDLITLTLRVRNDGDVAWPAARGNDDRYTVRLEARWHVPDAAGTDVVWHFESLPLRHDVAPGETLTQTVDLEVPTRQASYRLELRVHQVGGRAFDEASATTLPIVVRPVAD